MPKQIRAFVYTEMSVPRNKRKASRNSGSQSTLGCFQDTLPPAHMEEQKCTFQEESRLSTRGLYTSMLVGGRVKWDCLGRFSAKPRRRLESKAGSQSGGNDMCESGVFCGKSREKGGGPSCQGGRYINMHTYIYIYTYLVLVYHALSLSPRGFGIPAL